MAFAARCRTTSYDVVQCEKRPLVTCETWNAQQKYRYTNSWSTDNHCLAPTSLSIVSVGAVQLMRVIDRMVSFLVTRRRRAGRLEDRQRAREAEECESRRRLRHLLLYVEWCAAHWAERQLSQQSSASRIPHYTPVERWSTNAVSFVYTCHWRKSFQWLLCPMTARRSHWQYGACNFRTSTRLHRRSCLLSHSGDVGYVER